MPFSVLLLTAASSKRSISGFRGSTVIMNDQPRSGEVVLFFQIDKDHVRAGLNMRGQGVKCCDGLVFRSQDGEAEKVICLVEMKSDTIKNAADQLIGTHQKLVTRLEVECSLCTESLSNIKWTACIYGHVSSGDQASDYKTKLKDAGFRKITFLDEGHNDIGAFLRGEDELRSGRNRRH